MYLSKSDDIVEISLKSRIKFYGDFDQGQCNCLLKEKAKEMFEKYFHWRRKTKYNYTWTVDYSEPRKILKMSEVPFVLKIVIKKI